METRGSSSSQPDQPDNPLIPFQLQKAIFQWPTVREQFSVEEREHLNQAVDELRQDQVLQIETTLLSQNSTLKRPLSQKALERKAGKTQESREAQVVPPISWSRNQTFARATFDKWFAPSKGKAPISPSETEGEADPKSPENMESPPIIQGEESQAPRSANSEADSATTRGEVAQAFHEFLGENDERGQDTEAAVRPGPAEAGSRQSYRPPPADESAPSNADESLPGSQNRLVLPQVPANITLTPEQFSQLFQGFLSTKGHTAREDQTFKPERIGFFDPPNYFRESSDKRMEGSKTIYQDVCSFVDSIRAYEQSNPTHLGAMTRSLHFCFMGEAQAWFASEVPYKVKQALWDVTKPTQGVGRWIQLLEKRWQIPIRQAEERLAKLKYTTRDAESMKDISNFAMRVFRYAKYADEPERKYLRILYDKIDPALMIGRPEPIPTMDREDYVAELRSLMPIWRRMIQAEIFSPDKSKKDSTPPAKPYFSRYPTRLPRRPGTWTTQATTSSQMASQPVTGPFNPEKNLNSQGVRQPSTRFQSNKTTSFTPYKGQPRNMFRKPGEKEYQVAEEVAYPYIGDELNDDFVSMMESKGYHWIGIASNSDEMEESIDDTAKGHSEEEEQQPEPPEPTSGEELYFFPAEWIQQTNEILACNQCWHTFSSTVTMNKHLESCKAVPPSDPKRWLEQEIKVAQVSPPESAEIKPRTTYARIVVRGHPHGKSMEACVDSGAGRCLISSNYLREMSNVRMNTRVKATLRGIGTMTAIGWATFDLWVRGRLPNGKTRIAQLQAGAWVVDKLDAGLLLGQEFNIPYGLDILNSIRKIRVTKASRLLLPAKIFHQGTIQANKVYAQQDLDVPPYSTLPIAVTADVPTSKGPTSCLCPITRGFIHP